MWKFSMKNFHVRRFYVKFSSLSHYLTSFSFHHLCLWEWGKNWNFYGKIFSLSNRLRFFDCRIVVAQKFRLIASAKIGLPKLVFLRLASCESMCAFKRTLWIRSFDLKNFLLSMKRTSNNSLLRFSDSTKGFWLSKSFGWSLLQKIDLPKFVCLRLAKACAVCMCVNAWKYRVEILSTQTAGRFSGRFSIWESQPVVYAHNCQRLLVRRGSVFG